METELASSLFISNARPVCTLGSRPPHNGEGTADRQRGSWSSQRNKTAGVGGRPQAARDFHTLAGWRGVSGSHLQLAMGLVERV